MIPGQMVSIPSGSVLAGSVLSDSVLCAVTLKPISEVDSLPAHLSEPTPDTWELIPDSF